jgi:Tfp pilus assembly major pilin PilA
MTLKNKPRGTVAGKKDPVVKGKAKPTVRGKANPIVRGKAKPVIAKDAKANPRGASAGQVKGAKAFSSGRSLLKTLFSRLSVPAAIAGLGYQAYSAKKDVDTSVAQYEKQARKIAKESAALKAPPKRGNNLFLAGEKVNVNKSALKALETREVKPRAMDNPAKAKEPKDSGRTVKELSFGKAFAAARKAGKKEFTWKGKRYHTRTKEEEAKREKSAVRTKRRKMKVGKPGYNRRTVK